MVVLRDGEWSVWCHCGWRSPVFPALSQLTARHPCGSGGTLAIKGRQAATPIQGGDAASATTCQRNTGADVIYPLVAHATTVRTNVRVHRLPTANSRPQGGRQPGRNKTPL
jgi:hypothetical protein